jgi:hypothetical protein
LARTSQNTFASCAFRKSAPSSASAVDAATSEVEGILKLLLLYVLSSMLMHRREGGNKEGLEGDDVGGGTAAGGMSNGKANAVEAVGGAEPVVSAVLPQLHAGTHARRLPVPVGCLLHASGRVHRPNEAFGGRTTLIDY